MLPSLRFFVGAARPRRFPSDYSWIYSRLFLLQQRRHRYSQRKSLSMFPFTSFYCSRSLIFFFNLFCYFSFFFFRKANFNFFTLIVYSSLYYLFTLSKGFFFIIINFSSALVNFSFFLRIYFLKKRLAESSQVTDMFFNSKVFTKKRRRRRAS